MRIYIYQFHPLVQRRVVLPHANRGELLGARRRVVADMHAHGSQYLAQGFHL